MILAQNVRRASSVKNLMLNLKKNIMSELKIKPLGLRVVVQPHEAETKTASGIYIPDSAQEKPQKGTVLAVGKGTKDEEMEVKVGDNVLYGKYAGTEIEIDGTNYLIMTQSDILAVI